MEATVFGVYPPAWAIYVQAIDQLLFNVFASGFRFDVKLRNKRMADVPDRKNYISDIYCSRLKERLRTRETTRAIHSYNYDA